LFLALSALLWRFTRLRRTCYRLLDGLVRRGLNLKQNLFARALELRCSRRRRCNARP